jgi:hypothetical protein
MPRKAFGLEGDEQIDHLSMAGQGLLCDAYVIVTMPTHDIRVVFPPAKEVQPTNRTGTGE